MRIFSQILVSCSRPITLVSLQGHFLVTHLSGVSVDQHLGGGHGDDLLIVPSRLLGGRGLGLTSHPVLIHDVTFYTVTFSHRLGSLDHRHVRVLGLIEHVSVLLTMGVYVLVLHQTHRFQTTGDHHVQLVVDDGVGRDSDGNHAG